MSTIKLRADHFINPGETFHFTRTVLSRHPQRQLHTHDYYELFWLHHGRARHKINGQDQTLTEGDLVFIRPKDRHSLQGKGEETHLVNVIFPTPLIDALARRHNIDDHFFWSRSNYPVKVRRDVRQLAELSARAMALEAGPRNLLAAETFLLPLINELSTNAAPLATDLPDWLSKVCMAAQKPKVYREGSAGLVRISGRTHAHVSRSFQKFLGETPSDYINRIRMDHAERALVGTSDPIAEIAADCGIPNLSHFHKLFRKHHEMTPNQFRKLYQKNATQPV